RISRFASTPECGMEVGMSKNEPSLREGINSSPRPGKVSDIADQPEDSLRFQPNFSVVFGIMANTLSKPIEVLAPMRRLTTGALRNRPLLLTRHINNLG